MNIIDFAEALVMFLEAKEKVASKEVAELLQLASEKVTCSFAHIQTMESNPL